MHFSSSAGSFIFRSDGRIECLESHFKQCGKSVFIIFKHRAGIVRRSQTLLLLENLSPTVNLQALDNSAL